MFDDVGEAMGALINRLERRMEACPECEAIKPAIGPAPCQSCMDDRNLIDGAIEACCDAEGAF